MAMAALAHLSLAALGVFNRLEFTQNSVFAIIELAASMEIWVPVHFLCGASIMYVLWWNRYELQALSASAGFMFTWSLFNLLWGFTTNYPVSLAGPALAMSFAGLSYVLAVTYTKIPQGVAFNAGRT